MADVMVVKELFRLCFPVVAGVGFTVSRFYGF